MKNAIIFHGTGDTPNLYWLPYLKRELTKWGYDVWIPRLPNAEKPNLNDWLTYVLDKGKFTKETILVGHSAGSQLILSILENVNVKIKQAVLVSGYAESLPNAVGAEKQKLNWFKIKNHVDGVVFINSDNDPWGCNDTQGRKMLDKLGGILIIPKGEGHMGSTTYKQPYKKFPLLIALIDLQ